MHVICVAIRDQIIVENVLLPLMKVSGKMLKGLCWDDSYTIARWLEHRWPQAKVPGSSPGGDSQFFLQIFPVCIFPLKLIVVLLCHDFVIATYNV